MAITPTDLVTPTGFVDKALMFPADDPTYFTNTRLAGYIAQGEIEAAALTGSGVFDPAVKAYSHFRAFDAWATRLGGTPAKVDIKTDISVEFLLNQLQDARKKADAFYAEFLGYFPKPSAPAVSNQQSGFVPIISVT